MRPNRRGIPAEFKASKGQTKMKKGEVKHGDVPDGKVIQWMDKRPVTVLTTMHDTSLVEKTRRTRHSATGREVVSKPVAVAEYNTFMGGVDKSDQLLSYYTFHHRTQKWWKRAAFHLLNLACVNAYIIYSESHSPRKLIHELFLVEAAKGLLTQAGTSSADLENANETFSAPAEVLHSFRLTGRHFLEELPPCDSGRIRQCVCVVCSKKKGRRKVTTRYRCKSCKLALCPTTCFELYHTKADPVRYLPAFEN